MTLRSVLAMANACAWIAVVTIREPLPESFFAERDAAQVHGGVHINSGDPLLVVVGRPLWQWSEFHGGERAVVKVLEVMNLLPFGAIVIGDAVLWTGTTVQTWMRSVLAFAGILLLTTCQWWLVGTAVARFRAWRQLRRVELDELEAAQQ
jgi:hypothetical protein